MQPKFDRFSSLCCSFTELTPSKVKFKVQNWKFQKTANFNQNFSIRRFTSWNFLHSFIRLNVNGYNLGVCTCRVGRTFFLNGLEDPKFSFIWKVKKWKDDEVDHQLDGGGARVPQTLERSPHSPDLTVWSKKISWQYQIEVPAFSAIYAKNKSRLIAWANPAWPWRWTINNH